MNIFDLRVPHDPLQARQELPLHWDGERAVFDGYLRSPLVYVAVETLAKACSQLPLHIEERRPGSRQWEPRPEHPLNHQVLDTPDPRMPRMAWQWGLIQDLGTAGAFTLYKARDRRGLLRYLYGIEPRHLRPVRGQGPHLEGFRYRGRERLIPAADVIYGFLPSPTGRLEPMSPMQAVAREVDADNLASDWNRRLFRGRALPDWVLVDPALKNRKQLEEAAQWWQEQATQRDEASTPRGPIVLGGNATFHKTSYTQQDVDWRGGRELNLKLVAIAYGFLSAMWSEDASTYSNLRNAVEYMWRNAAVPWCRLIAEYLTAGLIPEPQRPRTRVAFDFSGVPALSREKDLRSQIYSRLVASGVPISEAAHIAELEVNELPNNLGRHPLIASNLRPLAEVVGEPDRT